MNETMQRPVTVYRRALDALAKVDEARIRAEAAHLSWLAADAEQDAANQAYNDAKAELDALTKIGAS